MLQSDSFDYSVCPCVELVVKSIFFLFMKEEEDEAATETVIEAGRRSNRRH